MINMVYIDLFSHLYSLALVQEATTERSLGRSRHLVRSPNRNRLTRRPVGTSSQTLQRKALGTATLMLWLGNHNSMRANRMTEQKKFARYNWKTSSNTIFWPLTWLIFFKPLSFQCPIYSAFDRGPSGFHRQNHRNRPEMFGKRIKSARKWHTKLIFS